MERMMRKVWSRKKGFTLIELLIVVAIIGILAGIAIPNFLGARTKARVSRAFADMRTIGNALEMYYLDNQDYPTTSEFTSSSSGGLLENGTYLASLPTDPFNSGNNYRYYVTDDTTPDYWLLVSNGPDGDIDVQEGDGTFSWSARKSGQMGGSDGYIAAFGYTDADDAWYDPTEGTTAGGDLGRSGP